jgi:hypothetical protein
LEHAKFDDPRDRRRFFDGGDNQIAIATNQKDPHNPAAGTDPTKECLNTIDAGFPSSKGFPLVPITREKNFQVEWSGQDDGTK